LNNKILYLGNVDIKLLYNTLKILDNQLLYHNILKI